MVTMMTSFQVSTARLDYLVELKSGPKVTALRISESKLINFIALLSYVAR